jgi:hypothetical protein
VLFSVYLDDLLTELRSVQLGIGGLWYGGGGYADYSILLDFKCWNTCVKLIFGVPRSTFNYQVELLAEDQTSLRNQILARYPGF